MLLMYALWRRNRNLSGPIMNDGWTGGRYENVLSYGLQVNCLLQLSPLLSLSLASCSGQHQHRCSYHLPGWEHHVGGGGESLERRRGHRRQGWSRRQRPGAAPLRLQHEGEGTRGLFRVLFAQNQRWRQRLKDGGTVARAEHALPNY